MEELLELKQKLLNGDISGAIALVDFLEEMSKDDKINNIQSFAVILLKHLVKQQVEQRTTNSWDVSIQNSVSEIEQRNKRRKSGGYYLTLEELRNVFDDAYIRAIRSASLEVWDGKYDASLLANVVNRDEIIEQALSFFI